MKKKINLVENLNYDMYLRLIEGAEVISYSGVANGVLDLLEEVKKSINLIISRSTGDIEVKFKISQKENDDICD